VKPPPPELFARVRSLPAAAPLLEALGDGTGVYLVGGAVRDLLLGGAPVDLDLVVEGDPSTIAARLGSAVRAHDRFGTATVVGGGFAYDIARARRERYARPGALPDVAPASLAEDLTRRDFTVNAIAVALSGQAPGELHAVPAALADLCAGRLRVLHDASFRDDPTRLLRMARYASRLAFTVEPHTLALARRAVGDGAIATVSGARVGAELRLAAREGDPLAAFACLHALSLDTAVDPRFGIADPALARRAVALLPADGRRDRLVLALASREVPPGELPALLSALAFEAGDRDAIVAAATRARALARALERAQRPSEIAAAAAGAGPELVALAGAMGPERPAREWLQCLRQVALEIDGAALLDAGIPQGPAVGRGLRAALAAKLDGRASGPEAELAAAVAAASGSG
jgi:tRNA nucleotidyltransferase (CCA-adding enzyme)